MYPVYYYNNFIVYGCKVITFLCYHQTFGHKYTIFAFIVSN